MHSMHGMVGWKTPEKLVFGNYGASRLQKTSKGVLLSTSFKTAHCKFRALFFVETLDITGSITAITPQVKQIVWNILSIGRSIMRRDPKNKVILWKVEAVWKGPPPGLRERLKSPTRWGIQTLLGWCNGMGPNQRGDPTTKTLWRAPQRGRNTRKPHRAAGRLFSSEPGLKRCGKTVHVAHETNHMPSHQSKNFLGSCATRLCRSRIC